MRRPILVAVLFAVAILPAQAEAVPIHHHIEVTRPIEKHGKAKLPDLVIKYDVAPKPKPAPVAQPVSEPLAPAPAPAMTVAPAPVAPSGGCPASMAGEATSPDAVNPSSGAAGCFQVLPSTAAAMGPACSDVNSSSCLAAICSAQGNSAWAASGSTPCG